MNVIKAEDARKILNEGGVIAYPTEAIYGLGCLPYHQKAVETIFSLKKRDEAKGFILLIADWKQLDDLIAPITPNQLAKIKETWPGFVTWIFPKSKSLPQWLTGSHDGIAIRMTAHPIARILCSEGPIISTSANLSNNQPARTQKEIMELFPTGISAIIEGELGGYQKPSPIFDIQTGLQIR